MARRKSSLPLREGTKLPPLTEEERLRRRTVGHPLDDFPPTQRMSRWREVTSPPLSPPATKQGSIIRSDERSLKGSTERSSERSVEPLSEKHTKEAYVALDATHTASEAKVYGLLYRLSVAKGQPTCRASLAEMQTALGLSKNTIIKALRGLKEKFSIDVLQSRPGSKVGSLYCVYSVKDILKRRNEANIEIDELKRVVPKGSIKRSVERLIERAKTERSMVQNLNVQLNVQSDVNQLSAKELHQRARKSKNLFLRNDDDVNTSSSNSDDEADDDSASQLQIRRIYCDLTGNPWRSQDQEHVAVLADIPIAHVILGICYSLDRASGHSVGSLKYCIPSIIDHYEAMRTFPEPALMEIAYTHMMKIKQFQKTRKEQENSDSN